MLLSRWKLMAGVLGVSLGGLAAVTGQCPKVDSSKSTRRQAEPVPAFDIPMLPTVPSGGTPSQKLPAAPTLPAPVSTPSLPPAPTTELPPAPPVADLPSLPAPVKTPELPKPSALPSAPPSPVIPASGTDVKPLLPPPGPAPAEPAAKPPTPAATPAPASNYPAPSPSAPPASGPAATPSVPAEDIPPSPAIEPSPRKSPKPELYDAPKPVATKYRILLRVGEGEPSFEVKCGDDLILKVICEKIDIKSPEKGNGLSAVKASGKVRFAGFGAEGTCEELSFLAGTGEVSLAGSVKIQVKDKLGRIESELSTETMKYKIDPSAAFTGGKP